jgi:hypothetical protein
MNTETIIIIFHTPKHSLEELKAVALNLSKKTTNPHIVLQNFRETKEFKKILSFSQKNIVLYLLGHSDGTLDKLAGQTSEKLADNIADLNATLLKKQNTVSKIYISSCNLGMLYPQYEAFVDTFALALTKQLKNKENIHISAPTGLLIFDMEGNPYVVKDDNPLGPTDKKTDQLLKTVDIKKPELLKAVFVEQFFRTATALDLSFLSEMIKKNHFKLVDDKPISKQGKHIEFKYGSSGDKNPYLEINSFTLQLITKTWAMMETTHLHQEHDENIDETPLKNKKFYV